MPSWSDIINTLKNSNVDRTDAINSFLHNSLKRVLPNISESILLRRKVAFKCNIQ